MRCYECNRPVEFNAFADLEDDRFDQVVEHYSLIALRGAEELFDDEGTVVVCEQCIHEVPR